MTKLTKPNKSDVRRELRDRQRAWLRGVIERAGKTASGLARQVGLAEVTITRFLNQAEYDGVLSPPTVRLICQAMGDPGPDAARPFIPGNHDVPEARPLDLHGVTKALKAVRALLDPDRNSFLIYELTTATIEAAGYRAGDIVVVDQSIADTSDSAVCALCGGQTIFRINRSQVLLGATFNPLEGPAPLFVDNANVKIVGPIVHLVRSVA